MSRDGLMCKFLRTAGRFFRPTLAGSAGSCMFRFADIRGEMRWMRRIRPRISVAIRVRERTVRQRNRRRPALPAKTNVLLRYYRDG